MFFNESTVNQLIDLVQLAGDTILKKYYRNTTFKFKEDNTPITEADLLSHSIITNGLQQITPNINILSEESGFIDFNERQTWEEYWLIDPLDGTRGFIDETDDFCVCLSYIKNDEPIFGLIYAPFNKTTYLSNSKDTAYKIQNNIWQKISAKKPKEVLDVVVGRYSIEQHRVKQHLCGVLGRSSYNLHGMGSALKFCLIAEGKYDYYPALGICSEWDTAAGSFILQSAGGYVLDFNGNHLKYNTKRDMISPVFFASGDFILHNS